MGERNLFQKKSGLVIGALFACLLWGSAFPSLKITYAELAISGEFEKILIAGMRFSLAGIGVLVFARIKMKVALLPLRREIPLIAFLALFQMLASYALFYIGLGHTNAVKSSILTSVSVFFVAVLAHFMFNSDRMSWKKGAGLLLGFAGVIFANISIIDSSFSFTFIGEGFILLHSFFIAITTVLVRKYAHNVNVVRINGWQLFTGGVLLFAVGYAGHPVIPVFNAISLGLLFYTAALSAVAFTLWFVLLRYHKATVVEQYKFAVPLFGSVLSLIFVSGEHMGIEMIAAAVLVAAGIIIVNRTDSARI